jgi:hypothetical protein
VCVWFVLNGDQDFGSYSGSVTGDVYSEDCFCISITIDSMKQSPP